MQQTFKVIIGLRTRMIGLLLVFWDSVLMMSTHSSLILAPTALLFALLLRNNTKATEQAV